MYAILRDKESAEALEAAIHTNLKKNRERYNAVKWADVKKNPEKEEYIVPLHPEQMDLSGYDAVVVDELPEDYKEKSEL